MPDFLFNLSTWWIGWLHVHPFAFWSMIAVGLVANLAAAATPRAK